jgi:hypothetical protein
MNNMADLITGIPNIALIGAVLGAYFLYTECDIEEPEDSGDDEE